MELAVQDGTLAEAPARWDPEAVVPALPPHAGPEHPLARVGIHQEHAHEVVAQVPVVEAGHHGVADALLVVGRSDAGAEAEERGAASGLPVLPRRLRPARRPGVGDRAHPSTCAGSVTVKVEPSPGSLSTSMSPPMRRQKRRLITSPRPVPP